MWFVCPQTLESLLPLRVASLTLIPQHPTLAHHAGNQPKQTTPPAPKNSEYLTRFTSTVTLGYAKRLCPRDCCPALAFAPHIVQDGTQLNPHQPSTIGKAPCEGRGIVVQDQQDPSTHLDGAVERGLARIVADICFQLVLVVGIGTDPVGRLLRQLSQGGMTLQARHEIADRLQPSVGDEPQAECKKTEIPSQDPNFRRCLESRHPSYSRAQR